MRNLILIPLYMVGGFAYFYLCLGIGALTAGAGHGQYLLFDYSGGIGVVGWWSRLYWVGAGLCFGLRRIRGFAICALVLLSFPYVAVAAKALSGAYRSDKFSADPIVLTAWAIFLFTQIYFFYYLISSVRRFGKTKV